MSGLAVIAERFTLLSCQARLGRDEWLWYNFSIAPVVELADMLDLGSCGVLRAGSSPVTRTTLRRHF